MIRIEKFEKLKNKFKDKGELESFYWLVPPPPPFEFGKTFGTYEEQIETYKKIIETVYGKDWDEIDTWIDYRNYK